MHLFLTALNQGVQSADEWGFRISSAKSKFMNFGFKRKIPDLNCSVYDCPLKRDSAVFRSAAKSILGKLDRTQAKALKICCGACRTSLFWPYWWKWGNHHCKSEEANWGSITGKN